jgi:Fe-S cluster assembly iron-binding protein IscA
VGTSFHGIIKVKMNFKVIELDQYFLCALQILYFVKEHNLAVIIKQSSVKCLEDDTITYHKAKLLFSAT